MEPSCSPKWEIRFKDKSTYSWRISTSSPARLRLRRQDRRSHVWKAGTRKLEASFDAKTGILTWDKHKVQGGGQARNERDGSAAIHKSAASGDPGFAPKRHPSAFRAFHEWSPVANPSSLLAADLPNVTSSPPARTRAAPRLQHHRTPASKRAVSTGTKNTSR